MSIDLTPEQWDALAALRRHVRNAAEVEDALDAVLAHRPKPTLPDGIYEIPHDGTLETTLLVFVTGNCYGFRRGVNGGPLTLPMPLPGDTSGWTRVPVLPPITDELIELWWNVYDRARGTTVCGRTEHAMREVLGMSREGES